MTQVKRVRNCGDLPQFGANGLDILMQTILVLDRIIMLTLDAFPPAATAWSSGWSWRRRRSAASPPLAWRRAPFYVRRVAPLGGPLLLDVGATRFLLRRSLARSIVARLEA